MVYWFRLGRGADRIDLVSSIHVDLVRFHEDCAISRYNSAKLSFVPHSLLCCEPPSSRTVGFSTQRTQYRKYHERRRTAMTEERIRDLESVEFDSHVCCVFESSRVLNSHECEFQFVCEYKLQSKCCTLTESQVDNNGAHSRARK